MSGKLCAICGKRTREQVFRFEQTLKDHGIEGQQAHVSCLTNHIRKRERLAKKRGGMQYV